MKDTERDRRCRSTIYGVMKRYEKRRTTANRASSVIHAGMTCIKLRQKGTADQVPLAPNSDLRPGGGNRERNELIEHFQEPS